MVLYKEVRDVLSLLQQKVAELGKNNENLKKKMEKENGILKNELNNLKKYNGQLNELVSGVIKKMTAWKQELDVFNKCSKEVFFL